MTLILYGHPFSSYTQKVQMALYENATPFELREVPSDEHMPALKAVWPLGRFPVLVDAGVPVIESSIIIEHLDLNHPGPVRFLPADPRAAMEARFMDRVFDLDVMGAFGPAVREALRSVPDRLEEARGAAGQKLELIYGWLEARFGDGRTWAAGSDLSLADCAAAPALFYADWVHPISEAFPRLGAYRAGLLARPSFARCVEEGRPFRPWFPLGAPDQD